MMINFSSLLVMLNNFYNKQTKEQTEVTKKL